MLLNVESKGNRRRTRGSEPIQTGSSHPFHVSFPAWQLRASLGCERGCWTGNRRWLAATKGMESKIKGGWQPCAAKRIRENREKEREREEEWNDALLRLSAAGSRWKAWTLLLRIKKWKRKAQGWWRFAFFAYYTRIYSHSMLYPTFTSFYEFRVIFYEFLSRFILISLSFSKSNCISFIWWVHFLSFVLCRVKFSRHIMHLRTFWEGILII